MIEIELNVPGRKPVVRRFEFGEYTFGRGFMADVRLKGGSVARQHAVLLVGEDELSLRSINSAELYKNGSRAQLKELIKVGDEFKIADCTLRVVSSLIHADATSRGLIASTDIGTQPLVLSAIQDASRPLTQRTPPPAVEIQSTEVIDKTFSLTEELRLLQEQVQALVLTELDLFRRTAMNQMSNANLRDEAREAIEKIIDSGAINLPASVDRPSFVARTTAEIMGYGPIEPFLGDESVSEVMVNGPESIYVERHGRLTQVPARFTSSESLMRVIERIVSPLGRRIDEGVPMVDARLPDGSRVNAIIPPLSLIGPILTIRKFSKQRFSMDRLVEIGALTAEMSAFLKICVHHRKNMVVSGGTGTGKTTFLNALSESIPPDERILTIEDAAELRLVQPHVLSLEARPPNVEGRGQVAIRDLVRNALRMRPDRIIIGECRGGEALDMLQAMNTGHDGSLTTGHANSPRDLLSRLEVMVLMAGMDLPVRAIREQISSAVDIVVQLTRSSDGRRRVTAIVEIDGMEGDVILTQPLFIFKQSGISPTGDVLGEHFGLGHAPRFYEQLTEAGVQLDLNIFGTSPSQQRMVV